MSNAISVSASSNVSTFLDFFIPFKKTTDTTDNKIYIFQAIVDRELADLRVKIAEFERRRDADQNEIQQRDLKIQQLVGELRSLVILFLKSAILILFENIYIETASLD